MSRNRNRVIKTLSRDYDSIIRDTVEYARNFKPDLSNDLSIAGFNSTFLDILSYNMDQLSFSLDFYLQESDPWTALLSDSLIRSGYTRGYKFSKNPSSFGTVTFYALVPADTLGVRPNENYMGIIKKGTELSTNDGNIFTLIQDVNLASERNRVVVAKQDNSTGAPTVFAIEAVGTVISGEIREISVPIGTFEKYRKVVIQDEFLSEVISVIDSDGESYYEVDNLSQDHVVRSYTNRESESSEIVKNILRPFPVVRRYTKQQVDGLTELTFGSASVGDVDDLSPIDPSNVAFKRVGKEYISETSFDPSVLIDSDSMGVGPSNTTLRVLYRANTVANVNAAAGTVTVVSRPILEFGNTNSLDRELIAFVRGSLEVTNDDPIVGDITFPDQNEIRQRIISSYAAQNRAVTKEDYSAVCYRMPPEFGSIKRVSAERDGNSFKNNINLYVVSENSDGSLVRSPGILRNNLKNWITQYKMVNDTVDILNAEILNLGIEFVVVGAANINKTTLKSRAIREIISELLILPEIGEPFSISRIYKALNSIDGVIDTSLVKVVNKSGGLYSDVSIDIRRATSKSGRSIIIPKNYIWEVKFPNSDIQGTVR